MAGRWLSFQYYQFRKHFFFFCFFGANTTNVLVLHFTAGLLSLVNSKLIRIRYLSRCSDRMRPVCMCVRESLAGSLFCYFSLLRSFYLSPFHRSFVRSSITPLHSTIFCFFIKKIFFSSLFVHFALLHSFSLPLLAQTAIVLSRSLAVCGVF